MKLTALPVHDLTDVTLDLEQLQALLPIPLTGAAWKTPTLINSWVLDGTAGNAPAGYLKDPFGFVHLRGRIKSGANGTTALVLPAGFRPAGTDNYPGVAQSAGVAVGAFVVVDASGNVQLFFSSAIANFSLTGINFLAEN